jgi:hypothetical protein
MASSGRKHGALQHFRDCRVIMAAPEGGPWCRCLREARHVFAHKPLDVRRVVPTGGRGTKVANYTLRNGGGGGEGQATTKKK